MKLYLDQVKRRINDLQAKIPEERTSRPTVLPRLLQRNI